MLRMRLTTSPRRRRPARTTALALIGLVVGTLPFVVPGVLAPKVAHAAPSVQTTFPLSEFNTQTNPTSIVSGPGGALWIAEGQDYVQKLTTSGTFSTYATSAMPNYAPGDDVEHGIAVGPDGNLWVTQQFTWTDASTQVSGVIARVSPAGTVAYFPTPTAGSDPYEITSGPAGDLWFTENSANKIGVVNTSGAMREFAIPTVSSAPTGIVAGPDGNLWFTESATNKIGRMTPVGAFTEFAVTAGSQPHDITVGPDGKLWFSEFGANAVGTMTTSGSGYTAYPTPTTNSGPMQVVTGPDGALWFAENNAGQIGRITTSGAITEYAPTQVPNFTGSGTRAAVPYGITSGPDGNIWYTDYPIGRAPGTAVGRLPLVPCGDLSSSVTSASHDSGVRDTPGSQESLQIGLENCGVPALTGAVTSTAVTSPSGCPSAPAIPSFTSTLTYGQSTSQTFSFSDPSCLGTYTVATTTTMGSTAVASTTTYYVVSNGHGSHIVGDFNGDGYQDVALADIMSGTVAVYYGGPNGLEARAPQVFTASSPGMPSQIAAASGFGWSLAAGNYNGDGYSDLAVGMGGAVAVLFGGPAGLTASGSQYIAAPGSMSSGFFGRDIVSGDFNHDGYSDVVISAPLQDVGSIAEEGAVDIMYGSASGLTGQTVLTENSPGVPGPAATRYDNFGWNMAAGDFNGDGNSDVAINEGENKNGVVVLYGSASGLTGRRSAVPAGSWGLGVLRLPGHREVQGRRL